MNRTAPSVICKRGTMALRYMRSIHSTSNTTCLCNTSETVCGSFDAGSVCGVPSRPGDRLRVVPFMEVIFLHFMHASGAYMFTGLGRSPAGVLFPKWLDRWIAPLAHAHGSVAATEPR